MMVFINAWTREDRHVHKWMLCKHPRRHIPNYKWVELVWRTQNVDHMICVLSKKPTDKWFQTAYEKMSGLSRLRNRKERAKGETMERCRKSGQNNNKGSALRHRRPFIKHIQIEKSKGYYRSINTEKNWEQTPVSLKYVNWCRTCRFKRGSRIEKEIKRSSMKMEGEETKYKTR